MDNVHFKMNTSQRKQTQRNWILIVSFICSFVSLCLNPWESHLHNIFLILSISASSSRVSHCKFLPTALRYFQHIIGVLFAIPPIILNYNEDQNLMDFDNSDLKIQVILMLDLTSILLKVVYIFINIRAASHSSNNNNTLKKLQAQAQAIIEEKIKNISSFTNSKDQAKSMSQSQNPNNKTDLKSIRLQNLDSNKRQLSSQIIQRNTEKQKENKEAPIKVMELLQAIKIGITKKKNNSKIVIQNYQDEDIGEKSKDHNLQEEEEEESENAVLRSNNIVLIEKILKEGKIINPQKEIISKQNGLQFDKNSPKQQQLLQQQFKQPMLADDMISEDAKLKKQVDSTCNVNHQNKNSQKSILLTQKKNPNSSSTQKQYQQEQQYPLESLIGCQEAQNIPQSLLLESSWGIKTQQNLSVELPNCNENHNNQSKPDLLGQSSAISSEAQEQLKMEQGNSVVKNKWRMKQRFLCDKIKNTSTPLFQSTTANINSGAVPVSENKQQDLSKQIQNCQVQISLENDEIQQKQLIFDLDFTANNTKKNSVNPLESDAKRAPEMSASTIQGESFLKIVSPKADSQIKIKEIQNDSMNENQIQINILINKSGKPAETSQSSDLNNKSNELDKVKDIKNDTEQQTNTLQCQKQKNLIERPSNSNQKPTPSVGGDELEISTNDESNFASINSACSQSNPISHQQACKNLTKVVKKPQSQQLKRSISGNSIGKSKSNIQLSFSADEISDKDNQAQQSDKVQHDQKQQSISILTDVDNGKRSSSQKCFEQFLQLKQGKPVNTKEVINVRSILNIQDQNGIRSQSKAGTEMIAQQQGKLNTKDCSVRQILENKVKQIAVRMKFQQDLHYDLEDSEEKGYGCSDNENSLGNNTGSEDDDENDSVDGNSEQDQSFSVSSRSTVLKEKGTCSDFPSDFHSPILSFTQQQQINSCQSFSLQQKQQFSGPNKEGQFSSQISQNTKCSQKKATQDKSSNENQQQDYSLNVSHCEGDVNEADSSMKRKKQKTQEQKKKRRNKRKENLKNKKFDSNIADKLYQPINGYDNTYNEQTHKPMKEDSQHSNLQLKRLLDENLLEYFTITLSLSAHITLSIYITDFYQFDEQFDLQSLSYGIDGSTILDTKINFIFQIITQQLYPAMADFFDSLLNSYAKQKQSHLLRKQTEGSKDFELLTQSFIESFDGLLEEINILDPNNYSQIQLQIDIFSALPNKLIEVQEQQQQKSDVNLLVAEINSSLNNQEEDVKQELCENSPLQLSS